MFGHVFASCLLLIDNFLLVSFALQTWRIMATSRATFVCYHTTDEVHKRQKICFRSVFQPDLKVLAHADLCPRLKVFDGKCPACANGVNTISPMYPCTAKTSKQMKQQIFMCSARRHYFVFGCGKRGCKMAKGGVLLQLRKLAVKEGENKEGRYRAKQDKSSVPVPAFFKPQCLTCSCEKPWTYCRRCSLLLERSIFNTGKCFKAYAAADSVAH